MKDLARAAKLLDTNKTVLMRYAITSYVNEVLASALISIMPLNRSDLTRRLGSQVEAVWSKLSKVDVSEHCETKGGFSYLSWSWAWAYVKDNYPDATFEKHLFDGLPYMIDAQGNAFVKVTVTIQGLPATEVLPVLNHSNKPVKNPDSFAVNTALQRCLVKVSRASVSVTTSIRARICLQALNVSDDGEASSMPRT